MTKFNNYKNYVDYMTKDATLLEDFYNTYKIYELKNATDTHAVFRTILDEAENGWQDGMFNDTSLYFKSDIDYLKHCIDGYDNDLEEPIDPDDPDGPKTSTEFWKNSIDEILGK